MVFSDKGGELNNALFKRELAKRNIKYFTTQNEDIKTSVAERVIRTLKTKLYRLFQKQGPVLVPGKNRSDVSLCVTKKAV